ncbi:hypothetical protein [Methylobacterium sp. JK268]
MADHPNTESRTPNDTGTEQARTASGGDPAANASDAEGRAEPRTHLQSRRRAATDSTVSPKSSTLQNLDAELHADLTQDVLTANRERMVAEIRASGGSAVDLQRLQDLHQAVVDAQAEVDAAIAKRNAARDAYDREAEAQAVGGHATHGEQVTAYIAAQNELRERQARMNAAAAQRAGA